MIDQDPAFLVHDKHLVQTISSRRPNQPDQVPLTAKTGSPDIQTLQSDLVCQYNSEISTAEHVLTRQ